MGLAAKTPDQVPEEMVTTLGGNPEIFETPPTWEEHEHYLSLIPGQSHHLAPHRAP